MRRHRTAVTAAAASLVAATIGLAAVLVVQTRANSELKSANLDLDLANRRVRDSYRDLQLANQRERGSLRPGARGDQDVSQRSQ